MTLTTDPGHVTVRMYNVGFGDAFLIVFPAQDRPRRVLIDCGSHPSGPHPRPIEEVVAQIVADVTDDDGTPRIDVVVGTHRHHDHVSGFAKHAWDSVEVDEVWMPWTEDPRDPTATRIRERQSALALQLDLALDGSATHATAPALAKNALTNESAMKTLHRGFAGKAVRRFLPMGDDVVGPLDCALSDAGIQVSVLGPARDEAIIRDMDPPAGAGYLRMAKAATGEGAASPFGASWRLTAGDVTGDKRLEHLLLSDKDRAAIEKTAEEDPFGVAVALEKAVNGTSLVLMFTQGDACLLFAGDAQWGTWKRMLDEPDARRLLEDTSFFKVGHHGSHNATPRAFVELLAERGENGSLGADRDAKDLWAMVSTGQVKQWKQIPKVELLDALEEVTPQLARSDAGAQERSPGFAEWTGDHIDAQVPTR